MLNKIFRKLIGTRNDRLLRRYALIVHQINAFEPALKTLPDDLLKIKTSLFRRRLHEGETLDAILPEAFAVVREVAFRTLGMRHFDEQLLGGMVLHYGKIAEMRTGEGKTLMSTLPIYLNALAGKGVHVVTVNDYLATRDAEWMGPIYDFLGLTVGINLTGLDPQAKKAAYAADITYGTNNEFGFDYLRDNMIFKLEQRVQRSLYYAVIDEVDSILIDEARTPLIISGQAEASSDLYTRMYAFIPHLKKQVLLEGETEEDISEDQRGDYIVDEKNRQVFLTEQGHHAIEKWLLQQGLMREGESLYDIANINLMHYINATLRAHTLYQRDVHYIVRDDEILIVDEHTGRLMPGRRWSDGLHQAVEAKENVSIQLENQTLATITFQNYFRLYDKLSGMTGTADTEAFELQKIYALEVIVIPTHKHMVRIDEPDRVYLTSQAKYTAIVDDIRTRHARGQPILIGTASIESSELVSRLLTAAHMKHSVLNAKQHEREAKIIAEAGRFGALTIATNMAGRGTDIVLGGHRDGRTLEEWQSEHDRVLAVGGLHVLGTERNEARRIDNQLRGRAGRQGDAGSSQFYLSLEDNLLRIFASDRMSAMMRRLGVKEDDVIESKIVSRAIENAQRRVEGYNFDIRKNLLQYDDVANDQRKVIYQQRYALLESVDIVDTIDALREEAIMHLVQQYIPSQTFVEQWDVVGLERRIAEDFHAKLDIQQWLRDDDHLYEDAVYQRIHQEITTSYHAKISHYDAQHVREIEKMMMLQVIDSHWKEHLAAMDHLRQGIHLRGYAQKNPSQEFKRESFELFKNMLHKIKYEVVSLVSRIELTSAAPPVAPPEPSPMQWIYHHDSAGAGLTASPAAATQEVAPVPTAFPKTGRNDPCSCGSGRKYKHCHGQL